MAAVWTTVVAVFPEDELARLVRQYSAAPPARRMKSTSHVPVLRGLRGGWRTIAGWGWRCCGAGLLAALGVDALLIENCIYSSTHLEAGVPRND